MTPRYGYAVWCGVTKLNTCTTHFGSTAGLPVTLLKPTHSNGCNFSCNISELGGVVKWPTKMDEILGAILVNQVG